MKLSDFISVCKNVLDEYGDLDVIYASDDEGNSYNDIYYAPTLGDYTGGEFTSEKDFEEAEEYIDGVDGSETVNYTINAVCIN